MHAHAPPHTHTCVQSVCLSDWTVAGWVTCQNQLLSDLAFISVLSGNDYLPKLRGFNLERVWDAYLDARAKNLFAPEVPLYGTQRAADD